MKKYLVLSLALMSPFASAAQWRTVCDDNITDGGYRAEFSIRSSASTIALTAKSFLGNETVNLTLVSSPSLPARPGADLIIRRRYMGPNGYVAYYVTGGKKDLNELEILKDGEKKGTIPCEHEREKPVASVTGDVAQGVWDAFEQAKAEIGSGMIARKMGAFDLRCSTTGYAAQCVFSQGVKGVASLERRHEVLGAQASDLVSALNGAGFSSRGALELAFVSCESKTAPVIVCPPVVDGGVDSCESKLVTETTCQLTPANQ